MMTPQQWLMTTYSCAYYTALHNPTQLYFDPRNWEKEEIKQFWEDLAFGDYDTYINVPTRKHANRFVASVRYEKWKQSRPFD